MIPRLNSGRHNAWEEVHKRKLESIVSESRKLNSFVNSILSPHHSPWNFFCTQTWVGMMLMNQPFYITGIEDVEKAKGSAFGAAGLFFFIFAISILHLIMDSMNNGGASSILSNSGASRDNDDGGYFDGWTGQRQNNGEYGQVPQFQDFEEENEGLSPRVGILS